MAQFDSADQAAPLNPSSSKLPTYDEVVHSHDHSRQTSTHSNSDIESLGKDEFRPQPYYPSFFKRPTESRREGKRFAGGCCGCCGSRIFIYFLIPIIIIAAAVFGGVFGHQAFSHRNRDSADATIPLTLVPVYVDASPAMMPPGTNISETGSTPNTVPMLGAKQSTSCLASSTSNSTWGCAASWNSTLQLTASAEVNPQLRQLEFQPQPNNVNETRYGPQTPRFDTTNFVLAPFTDNDNPNDLGVAFMTWFQYDKLVILPESLFQNSTSSSSSPIDTTQPLSPGDHPIYCWWNQTLSELWIYPASSSGSHTPNTTTGQYPDLVQVREKFVGGVSRTPVCRKMLVEEDGGVVPVQDEGDVVVQMETGGEGCGCSWFNAQF